MFLGAISGTAGKIIIKTYFATTFPSSSTNNNNSYFPYLRYFSESYTRHFIFILNNFWRQLCQPIGSSAFPAALWWSYLLLNTYVPYTVRQFNWWRYGWAVWDTNIRPYFPLFDETLRHVKLCNSVVSQGKLTLIILKIQ